MLVRFMPNISVDSLTVRQILAELKRPKNSSGEERPLDPTYHRAMNNIRNRPKNCRELASNVPSRLVKARRALEIG